MAIIAVAPKLVNDPLNFIGVMTSIRATSFSKGVLVPKADLDCGQGRCSDMLKTMPYKRLHQSCI
jgi:hypothetical protein